MAVLELLDRPFVLRVLVRRRRRRAAPMEYFRRSHRVIWGASSPPELPVSRLEGTGEG